MVKIKWLYREVKSKGEHSGGSTQAIQRRPEGQDRLGSDQSTKTANEIAAEYGVHPTQIAQWKRQALDGLPTLFSTPASDQAKGEEELIATLYQQIGQLKVQVDWLEKKSKALH